LKMDLNFYLTDMSQNLHFKQVFKVLELMGYDWVPQCHHISFGQIQFKGNVKMSTRKGTAIFLEDVLTQSIELVREIIEKRNTLTGDREKIAQEVGIGAVIFNDLMNDRVKNVEFDWDKVLNFEGDSGPYVQYCQVRCRSLIKKYGKPIEAKFKIDLESNEEKALVKHLLTLDHTLKTAFNNYKPNIVTQYLLDLCQVFGNFYHKHRILGESPDVEASRMTLIQCTQHVFEKALSVLNMSAPEAM
jgi:arginyl-tRNA synthetase